MASTALNVQSFHDPDERVEVEAHEMDLQKFTPLNSSSLSPSNITERHERIDLPVREGREGEVDPVKGVLCTIKKLKQGTTYVMDPAQIKPNPQQPRKYFDPEKIQILQDSILLNGQDEAVTVCTVVSLNNKKVTPLLVDGERRLRAIQGAGLPGIKVKFKPVKSAKELLRRSLIANITREGHNPMELAYALDELIQFEKAAGTRDPYARVCKDVGIKYGKMRFYLRLLDFDPEMQELVATGVVTATLAIDKMNLIKQACQGNLTQAKLASLILRRIEQDDDEADEFGHLKQTKGKQATGATRKQVNAALQELLLEGKTEDSAEVQGLILQKKVLKIKGLALGFARKAGEVLDAPVRSVVDTLIERTNQPPELVRDSLLAARDKIDQLLSVVLAAIGPNPLPEVDGKSKYFSFILNECSPDDFHDALTYKIACLLALASDHDMVLTSEEIAERLEIEDSRRIYGRYKYLRNDLRSLGLKIDEKKKRILDNRQRYKKVDAYRLAWTELTENEIENANASLRNYENVLDNEEHIDEIARSLVKKYPDGGAEPESEPEPEPEPEPDPERGDDKEKNEGDEVGEPDDDEGEDEPEEEDNEDDKNDEPEPEPEPKPRPSNPKLNPEKRTLEENLEALRNGEMTYMYFVTQYMELLDLHATQQKIVKALAKVADDGRTITCFGIHFSTEITEATVTNNLKEIIPFKLAEIGLVLSEENSGKAAAYTLKVKPKNGLPAKKIKQRTGQNKKEAKQGPEFNTLNDLQLFITRTLIPFLNERPRNKLTPAQLEKFGKILLTVVVSSNLQQTFNDYLGKIRIALGRSRGKKYIDDRLLNQIRHPRL